MSQTLPAPRPGAASASRRGEAPPPAPAPETAPAEAPAAPEIELALGEKAAIIIAALGPEAAPHILQGMGETSIRRFAQAMSRLNQIPQPVLDRVIEDFTRELGTGHEVKGGVTEARRILNGLLDKDSVNRILDDVDAGERTLWERLSNCSDQALAGFLRHEHPQTAAVILSKMRSDKAARILERLDPDFAQIIVLRLARVPRLDSEVMEILKGVIFRDFLSVVRREQATRRPADVIGAMMTNVSGANRARLLKQLEAEKPKLAKQVHKVMFTFADIADRLEPRDVGALLKAVDEPTLLRALKFAETNAPQVVAFIISNLARRMAQRLEGELKGLGDIKPRDGEAAQAAIVSTTRDLAAQGEISLTEPDDEE